VSGASEVSGCGRAGEILFEDVSKFYGEVLGVNRVSLAIAPGITSLVGPNGSGKTTLMNLLSGLIQPTEGNVSVLGISTREPERLFRTLGYGTQFDSFPQGLTGRGFVTSFLRLHGLPEADVRARAQLALERVGLAEAGRRRIAGYSKGMRQRIKLAQAISHEPRVLVLDEPLNGLDPLARSEMIGLFRDLAEGGLHLLISSHILHEVDLISDRVILMNEGYVVAEGDIRTVRREMSRHPLQVLIRCERPAELAARVLERGVASEVRLHPDDGGLLASTRDADAFFLELNRVVVDAGIEIEQVRPADEDVHAVYDYLINEGRRW
jgi:ABC-2 type transport system ATP-binding protein